MMENGTMMNLMGMEKCLMIKSSFFRHTLITPISINLMIFGSSMKDSLNLMLVMVKARLSYQMDRFLLETFPRIKSVARELTIPRKEILSKEDGKIID